MLGLEVPQDTTKSNGCNPSIENSLVLTEKVHKWSYLSFNAANIGDSGLLVVRDGRVVHRSSEQQHYFNTPYQLSLPPTDMESDVLADLPEAADRYEFNVEDGDVIILATDGIFDNVPDHLLVEQVRIA